MKLKLFAFTLALNLACQGQANSVFYFGGVNGSVPDNDPNGYQDSHTLAGVSGTISDVNATLVIPDAVEKVTY